MAILVASDCSPIRALHHLKLLHLCRDLYGTVIVPDAVRIELARPTATCPPIDIHAFPGFEVRAGQSVSPPPPVPADLDPGETEAITLAIGLHADLIPIDERKGTLPARQLGLTTIGVLGLLLEAKRKGLIAQVLPGVDRLVTELRFFISPKRRTRLAELAQE